MLWALKKWFKTVYNTDRYSDQSHRFFEHGLCVGGRRGHIVFLCGGGEIQFCGQAHYQIQYGNAPVTRAGTNYLPCPSYPHVQRLPIQWRGCCFAHGQGGPYAANVWVAFHNEASALCPDALQVRYFQRQRRRCIAEGQGWSPISNRASISSTTAGRSAMPSIM